MRSLIKCWMNPKRHFVSHRNSLIILILFPIRWSIVSIIYCIVSLLTILNIHNHRQHWEPFITIGIYQHLSRQVII